MRLVAFFVSCSLFVLGQDMVQDKAQTDWRFAHPDALLVGAIRPKALIESPILEEVLKQAGPKEGSSQQAVAMIGLAKNLLSGIKEVRFSLIQTGEPGKQKADIVALVDGRFDESILGIMMASQPATPDKPSFRRIDAQTLLIGLAPSLDKAAERMKLTEPKLRSRAFEGAETLALNDFWISGQVPENPFALLSGGVSALPEGLKPPTTPDFTKNLRRVAFGLSLRDGIDGELVLQTSTPQIADALVKEALQSIEKQPNFLVRLIGARAEGPTAHFTLNVPRSMALEAIRSTTKRETVATNTTPTAPMPLDPPKPVQPQKVVIQGLDQGTLEIALPQNHQ